MSATDTLNLFTLLLGFILLEVLSGLMRTLRARLPRGPGLRTEVHIGWLTPLLGAYAVLNVLLWWGNLSRLQTLLPVGYDTMTLGVILCGFFYFAASMIFPDKPRDWPEVDDWFWLHRRQVLGCILAANVPGMLQPYITQKMSFSETVVNSVLIGSEVALLLLAIFARRKWIAVSALAGLVALHLSFIPLDYLSRQGVW